MAGATLKYSTAYHPQTDGQTEVLNRCLEQYLRAFTSQHPQSWPKFLIWAELWYNTSFHSAIGMTPFEVLYGKPPRPIQTYVQGSSSIEAIDSDLKTREEVLCQLKQNLLKAQQRMKKQADQHRRELMFHEGDWVLVKLQPYRQNSLAQRLNHKLCRRYYGPFSVTRRIGAVAYQLALPAKSQVHPVFHISQLKPFVGTPVSSEIAEFPANGQDSQVYNDPLVILSSRVVTTDGLIKKQLLVQWSGLPVEESSWEDVAILQEVFPHFNLADQVCFDEGGNVTDSIRREMQTEEVTEKGETVEAVVEAAAEDRRIRRKPSWMKEYHM